jgi:hypothetical protein
VTGIFLIGAINRSERMGSNIAISVSGIKEGTYTAWTHKWTKDLPDSIMHYDYCYIVLDDKNDLFYVEYRDASGFQRYATYNLDDFSNIFLSPSGQNYRQKSSAWNYESVAKMGDVWLYSRGISTSVQTYLLILRYDLKTLEVFREGSLLWDHDASGEGATSVEKGGISLTGKWVLVCVDTAGGYRLILYEGS